MLVVLLAAAELKQGHAQTLLVHVEGQHVPEALLSRVIRKRAALPTAHTHALTMMSIIITHAEPGKTKKKNAIMDQTGITYINAMATSRKEGTG